MPELLFFCICIAALIHAPMVVRYFERRRLLDVIRIGVEKNTPIPDQLLEALRQPARRISFSPGDPRGARNLGILVMCLSFGAMVFGAALAGVLFYSGEDEWLMGGGLMAAGGFIVLMLGLGLFIIGHTRLKDAD